MFCPQCGARLDSRGEEPAGGPPPTPRERFTQRLAGRPETNDSEEELWEGGYSPKAMIGTYLLAALLTIALLVVAVIMPPAWLGVAPVVLVMWLGIGLTVAYRRMEISYRLTNQRFVHERGIIRRVIDRIEVIDMDDVTLEQGLLQRMVGVGTIRISSSDRSHPELRLTGIDDVRRIANLLDDTRRSERRRRGIHIESI